jgi:hypothetical protein
VNKAVRTTYRPSLRGKYQIVSNGRFAFPEGLQQLPITQFLQNAPNLPRQVRAPGLLALRRRESSVHVVALDDDAAIGLSSLFPN